MKPCVSLLPSLVAALAAAACTQTSTASGPTSATPPPAASAATLAPAPSNAAPAAGSAPAGAGAPAPSSTPAGPGAAVPAAGGLAAADPIVGRPAPDFTATAQDGTTIHMSGLTGKPVVLYFYPKDETPGCTKEACSFRDAWQPLAKTGAVLIGVSADSADSHREFAAHWKLPFLLVTDADGSIAKLYDVPFHGVHKRQTIVIGKDGTVRRAYRNVDVTVHAQEILADLAQLP